MHERNKILLCSILIMTVISAVVAAVAIPILYNAAFEGQRRRLCEIAHFQAKLLATVGASSIDRHEAMRILQGAHESFEGFGQTGEFSVAHRQGDLVQFLLHRRHDSLITLQPLPFAGLQEKPMGRALLGMSGSMAGVDYRGVQVLAAYEPVPVLGWGVVAKIDISEIREPFVKAGIFAGGAALLVILSGVGLFFRLCDPLIRRLEASEASTQAVLDTAPDGIITFDGQGAIQSVNHAAERFFGYSSAEVVGQSIERLMPSLIEGQGHDRLETGVARGADAMPGVVRETIGYHRNGTPFPADVALSHMRLGEGERYTGIIRDITQRKRLEAQLCQLQKMQAVGTLVGGIAHDFNNVLAVILGYTELALLKLPGPSSVRRYLDDVLTAAERAKDLVQHILAFSRRHETERNRVQLSPLIRDALSLLRASLPSTINIQHHFDEKAEAVLADPTQIHQLLMNLGANAEYAMRRTGGVLDIRLNAVDLDDAAASVYPQLVPGPYVCLSIRDTGHGMAVDVMERIFEPFFTTKGVGEGAGMGLAVVHGIVMNHGGAITVDSAPGQGTTFLVYLPRLLETAEVRESASEPMPRGKGQILFVDDEESLVRLGQEVLGPLGYSVVTYTSSREALEAFRVAPERFDLVITDHTMPQMPGDVLAYELRRIRPNIPIILCTGYSRTMNAEMARGAGIDALLMKPVDVPAWGTTIRRVMTQHSP